MTYACRYSNQTALVLSISNAARDDGAIHATDAVVS